MATPTLYWFDRFDDRIGILPLDSSLTHIEELGGEDTITFKTREAPAKGDRLLWKDGGRWREHVVCRTEERMRGFCSVHAESSMNELLDDYIEEHTFKGATAKEALAVALAPTRWAARDVEVSGKHDAMVYRANCLSVLRRIEEVWGCEIEPEVTVASGRVSTRTVHLRKTRGKWRGVRLTYGENMAGCRKTVLEDEVYTALYGYGAGLPSVDADGKWTGGYKRKITFGEVNGGVNWTGDEEARLIWGRWNANRTAKVHRFGQVTFSECDNPARLLALTKAALADATEPKVSIEVEGVALGGRVELGDEVAVIDTSRDPEWRFKARAVRIKRVIGSGERVSVTLSNKVPSSFEADAASEARIIAIEEANDVAAAGVAAMDAALANVATTADVQQAIADFSESIDDLSEVDF